MKIDATNPMRDRSIVKMVRVMWASDALPYTGRHYIQASRGYRRVVDGLWREIAWGRMGGFE